MFLDEFRRAVFHLPALIEEGESVVFTGGNLALNNQLRIPITKPEKSGTPV